MKLEDSVLLTKGVCLVMIPILAALADDVDPTLKVWGFTARGVMLAGAAGFSGLLGFLSTSFGSYLLKRNGVDARPKPEQNIKP